MVAFVFASSFASRPQLDRFRTKTARKPIGTVQGVRERVVSVLAPSDATRTESRDAQDSDESWQGLRDILPFPVLRKLNKTAQYLGNEAGAVKKPWDSVEVRMCLAFPDLYSIGMSSTGHVVLYSCINDDPRLLCDRAYLPEHDMEAALLAHKKPIFAVESKRNLADFDIVGMSLMYELCATNCLKMLQLAGIPYTWEERDAIAERYVDGPPLVFAGGLTPTANPEPYADFFDMFSIGDGELMLPEIGRVVADVLREDPNVSREGVLLALAQRVTGVYVPRFYAPTENGGVRPLRQDVPARVRKQNALPEPWRAMALVPLTDPVHNRLSIEVRRGCTRSCRFCLPGNVQRPARDVAPETVVESVAKGLETTGYNEFSLLSLSCSDWLSLPAVGIALKNKFQKENIALSLGSQRVDRFDNNIAKMVSGVRKSGLTFAPEAGTQRMRDVINKGLTNEDLLRGVRTAFEHGYAQVKLYFMIGLPGERDEDVKGIADTVKWLQRKCRKRGRKMIGIHLTISNFTPKPQTPFQWHSTSAEELLRKQKLLKRELQYCKHVKVNYTDARISAMENYIGRGDRRMGAVILRAHLNGAGMDAWWMSTATAYEAWTKAIEDSGLGWQYRRLEGGEWNLMETAPEAVRGVRGWYDESKQRGLDRKTLQPKQEITGEEQSPLDRALPWDHIDCGLDKGWLRDELFRALAGTLTPDCAFNECSSCGVCGDELGNNITITPPPIPEYSGDTYPDCDQRMRIRCGLRKTGALALASHLDTWHLLERLVRRASVPSTTGEDRQVIPLSYNGGFHPNPRISTASALSFGATAECEPYDFVLTKHMDLEAFKKSLSSVLPAGLEIVGDAVEVPLKELSLNAAVEYAEYAIALYTEDASAVNWPDLILKVRDSGPVIVERVNKKGKVGKRDLRSLLRGIEVAGKDEVLSVLRHVGLDSWPKNSIVCRVNVCCSASGALSADDFVRLLNVVHGGDNDVQLLHVHRLALYDGHARNLMDATSPYIIASDYVKHSWAPPRIARSKKAAAAAPKHTS